MHIHHQFVVRFVQLSVVRQKLNPENCKLYQSELIKIQCNQKTASKVKMILKFRFRRDGIISWLQL